MRMNMMLREGMILKKGRKARKNKSVVHLDIHIILTTQTNKCTHSHQLLKRECVLLEHHSLMIKITTKHF